MRRLCRTAQTHLDHAVRAARREDGLYDAYNLLRLSDDGSRADIEHLSEMLEGQVAAMSSGLLDADEVVRLHQRHVRLSAVSGGCRQLPALPGSPPAPVHRAKPRAGRPGGRESAPRQHCSMPVPRTCSSATSTGIYHFNADFHNASDLEAALDRLSGDWTSSRLRPNIGRPPSSSSNRSSTITDSPAARRPCMPSRGSVPSTGTWWPSCSWPFRRSILRRPRIGAGGIAGGADRPLLPDSGGTRLQQIGGRLRGLPHRPVLPHPGPRRCSTARDDWSGERGAPHPVGRAGLTVVEGSIRFTPLLLNDRDFGPGSGELAYLDVNHVAPPTRRSGHNTAAFTVCQVPVVRAHRRVRAPDCHHPRGRNRARGARMVAG